MTDSLRRIIEREAKRISTLDPYERYSASTVVTGRVLDSVSGDTSVATLEAVKMLERYGVLDPIAALGMTRFENVVRYIRELYGGETREIDYASIADDMDAEHARRTADPDIPTVPTNTASANQEAHEEKRNPPKRAKRN